MTLPTLQTFFILDPPRKISQDPTANFDQLNKWQWDLQRNAIPQQLATINVANAMRDVLSRIAALENVAKLDDPGTATLVETATKLNEVIDKIGEIITAADINTTPTALALAETEET